MTTISVIIPVLNEAANLPATLATVRSVAQVEMIVVDSGSQDDSIAIAEKFGAIVLRTPPGRALQMNAGAAIAQGDVLLFLHGDTRLPPHYDTYVDQVLASGAVAGAFELGIAGSSWGLRWVEWGVNWRSRRLQLPYGDQGIFLSAAQFHQLGGFPKLPIMEDFVFVRRLQQVGRVAIVSASVLTSGRRWQKHGVFKTTLMNQLVLLGYFLGVSPGRLAQWYRRLK